MAVWHWIVLIALAFIAGTFAGYHLFAKTHPSNGAIFISTKEDGSEKIRFVLPVDYDEIPKWDQIIFDVKKEDDK